MADSKSDPQQPQIVYPQNPFNSKTILVNVFGSILTGLVVKYGLGTMFPPDTVDQISMTLALGVMGVANIIIRKFTNGPLSFSAPLSQPAPQDLPAGTVAITTPHSSTPGLVSMVRLLPGPRTITVPEVPVPTPPPVPASVTVL